MTNRITTATCDLCEHDKDQHWTININTGLQMNGPCKDTDYEDAESDPCMCDYFEPKKEVNTVVRDIEICDDCATIAYDDGAEPEMMVTLGLEAADHDCIAKLEPEDNIRCDCACNKARFEWLRRQRKAEKLWVGGK